MYADAVYALTRAGQGWRLNGLVALGGVLPSVASPSPQRRPARGLMSAMEERVLLVEDDASIREVAPWACNRRGSGSPRSPTAEAGWRTPGSAGAGPPAWAGVHPTDRAVVV